MSFTVRLTVPIARALALLLCAGCLLPSGANALAIAQDRLAESATIVARLVVMTRPMTDMYCAAICRPTKTTP